MRKNILITGANGQLGKSLQRWAKQHDGVEERYAFFFTDVAELDITQTSEVAHFVQSHAIEVIINAAAYTAVDKAEGDIETAYRLNELAVKNLAEVAAANHAFLVHISTDYVFDGRAKQPYTEESIPHPISVYGSSKLAGEKAVLQSAARSAIIRTSWLYSPYGYNFVKTMLRLAAQQSQLNVVNDQYGAPTSAADLAHFIMQVVAHEEQMTQHEIYHFANRGAISWYDFAVQILALAQKSCRVNPITTADYPTAATRPAYSVFNLSKAESLLQSTIPDWKESLQQALPEIIYNVEHQII